MDSTTGIISELDAMHDRARDAFARRDADAYRDLMAPDFEYRQADGRVIGRDQLMRDVAAQSRRLDRARSSSSRERIDIDGGEDRATELLTQSGSFGVSVLLLVHRDWTFTRTGRYTWQRSRGRWWIQAIEVLEERVEPGRFHFGPKPPPIWRSDRADGSIGGPGCRLRHP